MGEMGGWMDGRDECIGGWVDGRDEWMDGGW